jgi:hypothetical protein
MASSMGTANPARNLLLLSAGGGAISRCAGAVGETGEAAEGELKCGGNARPVHGTVHVPWQDVMAQHGLCRQGGALHAVVGVHAAQGGPAAAVHIWSIWGKHGKAEAVSEAGVILPAFELEGSGEHENIQPGRGRAAGAPEESRLGTRAILGTGGEKAACRASARAWAECWDDAHGVLALLAGLRRPEADGGVVKGLPQPLKLPAAGSVKRPERRGPSLHGQLGGGSSGEVSGVALHRSVVRQAEAEGKGELVGQGDVCAGMGHDGESAVHSLVLGAYMI